MLEINGTAVPLRAESHEIIFPEGAGGLPTLKIGVVYKGKLATDRGRWLFAQLSRWQFPWARRLEGNHRRRWEWQRKLIESSVPARTEARSYRTIPPIC